MVRTGRRRRGPHLSRVEPPGPADDKLRETRERPFHFEAGIPGCAFPNPGYGTCLYRTASITLPTFAKISPISSSLTISGGLSAMVSPVTRIMTPCSWNAFSMAA